ncbi:aminotransferase class IV [Phenylobacterium sp.]|jgi:branched-chain amino acid aminotransferase/4-amino-4-deoxychorismate lyase|uniref:aminotransferase class IV n=1 Tax=Phenylobacterium sp. TaxID=1871053 RepID=UPI002F953B62
MIGPDDRGLLLGDGLFETLLAEGGRLRDEQAHLDRLAAGCAALGLPEPDRAEAARRMHEALSSAGLDGARAAVRLTLTAGGGGRGLDRPDPLTPVMFATAAPSPKPAGPVRLATASIRRNETSAASQLKTLSYLDNVLARREARAASADEALMLNTRGELACAAAANLFWIAGERLFTPALDCGVLPGITRARVIAVARSAGVPLDEVATGPDALAAADAVFVTNSLVRLRRVESLDGRPFGSDPLLGVLAAALDGG